MSATHVLIRGHVFTYAEKAPFVPSGLSVLGAIEFEEASDSCRCHECGEFVRGLGNHIKKHGLKREQYNLRHGLRRNCALGAPSIGKLHRRRVKENGHKGIHAALEAIARSRPAMPSFSQSEETYNLNARCRAQLIFRTQMLAVQLGHFPNHQELRARGISASAIRSRFGSIPEMAALAGLQANGSGQKTPSPLPRDFPSREELEERWNRRMPWPEDYFGVRV